MLTFRVDPPFSRYADIRSTSEFYRRAAEALHALPGVEAVGSSSNLPFARLDVASPRIVIEGRQYGRADEEPFVNFQLVDAGYFSAMRIPLNRGRLFELTDDDASTPVAIVSERAARRFWNGEPIGRRLRVTWNQHGTGASGGADVWLTVVGVAGAVRFGGVDDDAGLDVYAPNRQMFAGDAFFVVRSGVPPRASIPQVRAAIDTIDCEQSFFDVQTMDERIAATLWHHRVSSAVLLTFAGVALATIWTYAVTAHAVAAERREIGVRMALGSSGGRIARLRHPAMDDTRGRRPRCRHADRDRGGRSAGRSSWH